MKQAKAQLDELEREVQTEQVRIMNQAKVAFQGGAFEREEDQRRSGQAQTRSLSVAETWCNI